MLVAVPLPRSVGARALIRPGAGPTAHPASQASQRDHRPALGRPPPRPAQLGADTGPRDREGQRPPAISRSWMRRTHQVRGMRSGEGLERLVVTDGPGHRHRSTRAAAAPSTRRPARRPPAARGPRLGPARTRTAGSTTGGRGARAPARRERPRGSSRRPSSAEPTPRAWTAGCTATGPIASTVPTRIPSSSSTGHGVISRWPTIRPAPSRRRAIASRRAPRRGSGRRSSASSGPGKGRQLDGRTPGSSPAASSRIETASGGVASDAKTPPWPAVIGRTIRPATSDARALPGSAARPATGRMCRSTISIDPFTRSSVNRNASLATLRRARISSFVSSSHSWRLNGPIAFLRVV